MRPWLDTNRNVKEETSCRCSNGPLCWKRARNEGTDVSTAGEYITRADEDNHNDWDINASPADVLEATM